jgi:DNA-binding XRE family transcriptional regulator
MPVYRRDVTRFIYSLVDPRDDTVRYVGCAIDVEERFNQHLRDNGNTSKCKWLTELKKQGLLPRLEILEVVDGFFSAFSREDYWIREMLSAGMPLTNSIVLAGVFTQPSEEEFTIFNWRGTKLRYARKQLRIPREEVAFRAGLTISTYNSAEAGHPVNQGIAKDILFAINSLLGGYGEPEVSLNDLGWRMK